MKIGNNERIVISLMKKYKKIDDEELKVLFLFLTGKKIRLDTMMHNLKVKGIVNEENHISDFSLLDDITSLEDFQIPKKIIDNLSAIKDRVKIRTLSRLILHVILKTEKCSLQFLSTFFKKSPQNIYAILQRLEERDLVVSYHSKAIHVNTNGRRYRPKYYLLSDLGKIWLQVHHNDKIDTKNVDEMLEKLDIERKNLVLQL